MKKKNFSFYKEFLLYVNVSSFGGVFNGSGYTQFEFEFLQSRVIFVIYLMQCDCFSLNFVLEIQIFNFYFVKSVMYIFDNTYYGIFTFRQKISRGQFGLLKVIIVLFLTSLNIIDIDYFKSKIFACGAEIGEF